MEFKFLGRGSAFNPKEGNTSAYFIEDKKLFLIDCGESVFNKIISINLFKDIEIVNLMITHTHSDHIGSLGTFIMYSYFNLNKPVNIIVKDDLKYIKNIDNIIHGFGVRDEMYNFIDEKNLDNKYKIFDKIRYVKTTHYNGLNCYSIIFKTAEGIVFYSGDTNSLSLISDIISTNDNINKIYIDVSSEDFVGNPHIYIGDLNKQIPQKLKNKIYCIHINNDKCIKLAEEMGFNVVECVR